jgi:glucose/arabinose dehydrogenase
MQEPLKKEVLKNLTTQPTKSTHKILRILAVWIVGLLALAPLPLRQAVSAQAGVNPFPDPSTFAWNPTVKGLSHPVVLTSAGDGSGRIFVVEKIGRIRILQSGVLLSQPFLDIHAKILATGGEQGLLGLAFHPDYVHNGQFFVNYTSRKNGATIIARYQVSGDANVANPASENILIRQSQPYANHNGGQMAFGPDGYLYIGLGDGGSAGDPRHNGQSLRNLLGKILRIDVNVPTGYTIPPGNPFTGSRQRPEIWAYGLRNPWRFSFDSVTGDLYIGDVGQNKWEEVDFLPTGSPGGANFGWNFREGTHPFSSRPPAGTILTAPVIEYSHKQGCAIIGGFVYHGQALPEFQGIYFYGDFCTGTIWGSIHSAAGVWLTHPLFHFSGLLGSFGVDEAGELYALDYAGGSISRLERK